MPISNPNPAEILITSQTVTSGSTIDFLNIFNQNFKQFRFNIQRMNVALSTGIGVQTGRSGTFTVANLQYSLMGLRDDNTTRNAVSFAGTSILLCAGVPDFGPPLSGDLFVDDRFIHLNLFSVRYQLKYFEDLATVARGVISQGSGSDNAAGAAITDLRFLNSGGTFTDATINVYGTN